MRGSLVSQSQRVRIGGSHVVPRISGFGVGVSVASHTVAVLLLLFVHHGWPPGVDLAPVELIMLPAGVSGPGSPVPASPVPGSPVPVPAAVGEAPAGIEEQAAEQASAQTPQQA